MFHPTWGTILIRESPLQVVVRMVPNHPQVMDQTTEFLQILASHKLDLLDLLDVVLGHDSTPMCHQDFTTQHLDWHETGHNRVKTCLRRGVQESNPLLSQIALVLTIVALVKLVPTGQTEVVREIGFQKSTITPRWCSAFHQQERKAKEQRLKILQSLIACMVDHGLPKEVFEVSLVIDKCLMSRQEAHLEPKLLDNLYRRQGLQIISRTRWKI